MDLQCDEEGRQLPCRGRLKIRRAVSSKISTSSSSSHESSSSFHGNCSSRQMKQRGVMNTVVRRRPMIFHTFDPEVIVAEPAEFMFVVQRLTGSAETRRLLRRTRSKTMRAGEEDPWGGGVRGWREPDVCTPTSPNHEGRLVSEENEGLCRREGGSMSPASSLTTNSEGAAMEVLSAAAICVHEAGGAEEVDASLINFFVFAGDSYYGTAHDEVESLFINQLTPVPSGSRRAPS